MKLWKAAAGVVLGVCFCALLPREVQAEENPFEISVGVAYIYETIYGARDFYTSYTEEAKYLPGFDNYDGCKTLSGQGNEFAHAHFVGGFPFWTWNDELDEAIEVTAEMSDAYWDQAYGVEVGAWEPVSGSTFAQNCHGFSTGWNCWVNDIAPILTDEWNYINDGMPKAGCIHALSEHSWKVPEIYDLSWWEELPPGWYRRSEMVRMEKNGTGGVYSFSHRLMGETADPPYWEQQ